ncbi:MAG: hypothetical protein NC131_21600 [Roseburia sp.]|nr:hypothetical protein [Roseburia sp.]
MTEKQILETITEQILRIAASIDQRRTRYVFTAITRIKDGKYYGMIDGKSYELPNGTNIDFKIAARVIVCIPNGDFKNRFIIAKNE